MERALSKDNSITVGFEITEYHEIRYPKNRTMGEEFRWILNNFTGMHIVCETEQEIKSLTNQAFIARKRGFNIKTKIRRFKTHFSFDCTENKF